MASMLTTIDNPYNPYTHWDEWLSYDISHGYNTCGYLARFSTLTMSDDEATEDQKNEEAVQAAIDSSRLPIYIKVTPDSVIKPIPISSVIDI